MHVRFFRVTDHIIVVALLVGLPAGVVSAGEPSTPQSRATPIADRYRAAAERIVGSALSGNDGYRKLEELCTTIGHRLSGSPQLDRATRWAVAAMKKDGQENVHREKVMVPHWVRGKESATMLKPRVEPLHILGLGGSVGTPLDGITAQVVVVADEDALDALGDGAHGKIVLFNKRMPPYDSEIGAGYGATVRYRTRGAALASAKGAVAALVRSVTATSLRSPHTGAMRYGEAETRIPTAAVSVEDAELIDRLIKQGKSVVLNLKMEAKTLPDAPSANVIGELRGREKPDEIIVIGGHIDSWDVGQGAHDDGGGCVMAMEAINVLRQLKMIPRRTIRVVLWTNEENGLAGGKAYAKVHADELANHVAAIETDSGVFEPRGYGTSCSDEEREARAVGQMADIISLFAPGGSAVLSSVSSSMTAGGHGGGADVGQMRDAGVVLIGHRVEGSTYFNYHHTFADTIDKVDPKMMSKNVAVLATLAYILADMPERIGGTATGK